MLINHVNKYNNANFAEKTSFKSDYVSPLLSTKIEKAANGAAVFTKKHANGKLSFNIDYPFTNTAQDFILPIKAWISTRDNGNISTVRKYLSGCMEVLTTRRDGTTAMRMIDDTKGATFMATYNQVGNLFTEAAVYNYNDKPCTLFVKHLPNGAITEGVSWEA